MSVCSKNPLNSLFLPLSSKFSIIFTKPTFPNASTFLQVYRIKMEKKTKKTDHKATFKFLKVIYSTLHLSSS